MGPVIGRKVIIDIEKIVASAKTPTDIQTYVNKARIQFEKNLSSKVKKNNKSMSKKIHKHQQLLRSGIGSCKRTNHDEGEFPEAH